MNRRAAPAVLTAADSPEPCLTAPQTHLNSVLTSANTTAKPFSPRTRRGVCTAVHFKLVSVSNPLHTTHEERCLLKGGAHTVAAFARFYFWQRFTSPVRSWLDCSPAPTGHGSKRLAVHSGRTVPRALPAPSPAAFPLSITSRSAPLPPMCHLPRVLSKGYGPSANLF